jgi:Glycosyl hydrolases family 38 N-terminal domain
MLHRWLLFAFVCLPPTLQAQSKTEARETLWLVPHTHWEGAVFKTREEYLEIGLPHVVRALTLLKAHPEYRFALDQVCYVKPFLERYPEEEAAFRKFVAEGRLQLVGGIDTMHDNNMPGAESIVRQMLYGKGYYREKLGVDVKVGWALDTFGHNAQMPQLLKLGGYESYWFRPWIFPRNSSGKDLTARKSRRTGCLTVTECSGARLEICWNSPPFSGSGSTR